MNPSFLILLTITILFSSNMRPPASNNYMKIREFHIAFTTQSISQRALMATRCVTIFPAELEVSGIRNERN